VERRHRGWLGPAIDTVVKYRPFLLTVLAVLLIVLFVPSRSAGSTRTAGAVGSTNGAPPSSSEYGAASVGSSAALHAPNCDTVLGQVKMPTIYAPPCVAPFPAGEDNGGATWQGVTANTIKLALYLPANGPETAALNAAGLTESASAQIAQVKSAAELFERHVELYGRKIQVIPFMSSVTEVGTNSAAIEEANADAIQVASQVKPFLSLAIGTTQDNYDLDVAQRGVIDFSEYNWDDSTYQHVAPYLWGQYDNQHIFAALAAYLGRRIWGHKAQYAGASSYRDETRKIGVIYSTSSFTPSDIAEFNADAARYGIKFTAEVGVNDADGSVVAQQAQTAVIKLQRQGVTTVVPLAALYGLVESATAATKQAWFPEWIVNPFGFADSDQIAQLMDQAQWKHAFGMTSISPAIDPATADQNGVGLWRWQYGVNPPGTATYASLAISDLARIVTGLELAGPDLTPATFQAGMFDTPPRGGAFTAGRATAAIAFGKQGNWPTASYTAQNDYTQVYWSQKTHCVSSDGKTQRGCYLFTNDAKRFLWNQWSGGEPSVFGFAPTDITDFNGGEPPHERAPSYPEHNYY
jgi:hypothetical protein